MENGNANVKGVDTMLQLQTLFKTKVEKLLVSKDMNHCTKNEVFH